MSAWAVTMGAGATMGSCMRRLPFHPEDGIGPKSITLTPAMAKHNSRVSNGGGAQDPYAMDFHRLLRRGGAPRYQAAEGEDQNDPDGAAPHGALLLSAHGLPREPSPLALPPLASHTPPTVGHTAV